MCERWKQLIEGVLYVSYETNAEIATKLGLIVRVLKKMDQNITRVEVEKDVKKLKAGKTAG